jgi:SET domain-containing protein
MKKLYVKKSKIHGMGIYANEPIKKGEFISFVIGKKRKLQSRTKQEALSIPNWYGVSKTMWIDPGESIFRYFNHSCNPNSAIIGTKKVVARRNIDVGEEVTFDYSFTDADVLWEMNCLCRSTNCRKKIRSIQNLSPQTLKSHIPLIPKYFLNLYKKANPSVKIV